MAFDGFADNVAMTRDDKGVWSVTVGPLKADFCSYFFTVDGVRTLDFRNVFVMHQVMYIPEVFKVERGRITYIDNIGLVRPGLEHTTGFGTHK